MRSRLPALLLPLLLPGCGDSKPEPAAAKPEPEPAAKSEPAAAKPEPAAAATPEPAAAATPEPAASFEVVNLALADELPALLAEHSAKAKTAQLNPYVELWATWCGPCKRLEASMGDPRMVEAFAGVYLIRLDSDQWGPKLSSAGLDAGAIPVFFELDEAGKITGRKIDGGAWEEDIPENMAPPLGAFFHASDS